MYFQIKKKHFIKRGAQKTLIQFIDITKSVMYEDVNMQNEFLTVTNATVSHELRNPLQSLTA